MSRSYSVHRNLVTFDDRYEYLRLKSLVGDSTFGYDRYINQQFYRSGEWRDVREFVIVRDDACDLGIRGREIFDKRDITVHHMNPMTPENIVNGDEMILDPDNLICVTQNTHNAIHYGDASKLVRAEPIERRPGDTSPWRR